jgi:hypothetical protein
MSSDDTGKAREDHIGHSAGAGGSHPDAVSGVWPLPKLRPVSVKWHGAKVKAAFRNGAADGIRAAAKTVFDASQQAVPEDTSDLKQSGKLTVDEANLRAEITYGSGLPDARAVITHEKLEIRHDNGSAKYLENPLRELADEVGGLIATNIRKNIS